MSFMRISLDDDLYWKLVRLASEKKMRYYDLLESWIRDADSHRDEKTEIQKRTSSDTKKLASDTPDTKRKGTFSPDEIDQIKILYREGWSAGKIAREMNRGKSGVNYAINAMRKRGEL